MNTPDRGLTALENGLATVDLSDMVAVEVSGTEAASWLDALLTTSVSEMPPGTSHRSLFLSPTGHIRADITVVRTGEGFVLLQDPEQPDPIDTLLSPYLLSADVGLRRRALALFGVPRDPAIPSARWSARPSPLGNGVLLAFDPARRGEVAEALSATFVPATPADVENHRIRRGVARFPVDLTPSSIPAEAGLDGIVIDADKGCFPGQESVAKVRNLGHPAAVVVHLQSDRQVRPGDPILEAGEEVGKVTSAYASPGGTSLLARIRWKDPTEPRHLNDGRGHDFRLVPAVRPPG